MFLYIFPRLCCLALFEPVPGAQTLTQLNADPLYQQGTESGVVAHTLEHPLCHASGMTSGSSRDIIRAQLRDSRPTNEISCATNCDATDYLQIATIHIKSDLLLSACMHAHSLIIKAESKNIQGHIQINRY